VCARASIRRRRKSHRGFARALLRSSNRPRSLLARAPIRGMRHLRART
jgi:hypothetical protein